MSETQCRPPGYEWVRWLTGEDAQLLAWHLCQWIEDTAISREGLTTRIRALERNAYITVREQHWSKRLENTAGVCINEWLYHFDMRMRGGE